MKSIANGITIARIFLVLILLLIEPLSTSFYVIYLICGISDILDGYIARKLGTVSKLGEKLDSVADLLMVAVLFVVLLPIIRFPVMIYYWIIGLAVIRLISIGFAFIKYKTFGILHTIGNKATGLMLLLFPLLVQIDAFIYLLCLAATISAGEELCINLISKEFDGNRKSIFHR
jgi:CDP-diacylglycerol--glycerol-3-phosphate 3-phosphatidyltransferase